MLLHLQNEFGPEARQYVRPELPQGLNPARDSFAVAFWLRVPYGGGMRWATKDERMEPNSGIDMQCAKQGGVLVSNRSAAGSEPGFTLLMLPHAAYLTVGFIDAGGKAHTCSGIRLPADTRWHHIALLIDRHDALRLYVDAVPAAELDLTVFSHEQLGQADLNTGADTLDRYGIGDAYLEELSVTAVLPSAEDLRAVFDAGRLRHLQKEVSTRLSSLGAEYTPEMHACLQKALDVSLGGTTDKAAAYDALFSAYTEFLNAPQKDALLTLALLGDPHIGAPNDICSQRVETLLADTAASGIVPDALVGVGDNANDSKYEMGREAFSCFSELIQKHLPSAQFIACHGNHDTMYNSPEANYREGTRAYREGQHMFLRGTLLRKNAHVDEIFREVAGQYLAPGEEAGHSFGITVSGYHFLVLNTDYLLQTGSSRENWNLYGNVLDPIRHAVHLHDGTFTWLRHMLDLYESDGRPFFVVCHFPFIDTVPLSYYREINIEDNSIGVQDPRIRALFSEYEHLVYICGHLHSGLGVSGPVQVVSTETGRSFPEINISAMKAPARGYAPCPAGWQMFVYDDEIVLRARDYGAHSWLPEFDAVVPLTLKGALL
ncbi:MAG: metallophosphoesterase [Clostridia bacterium]|nr:metallophosphoesterase [Clostridia bacterium]